MRIGKTIEKSRVGNRDRFVLAFIDRFMRPTPVHKSEAFTRTEMIVLIAVVFILLSLMRPALILDHPQKADRIHCMNNLRLIGTAYRIWGNDSGDRYPASQSVAKGGWSEFLTNAGQGSLCWTNYAIMAIEFGQAPKLLVCPSDERKPADNFTNIANANLSYFVGVSASDDYPESLLGGDRNLGSGTKPELDYGFSPESGKGNDVAIQTNSKTGPVCWSLKMHSLGQPAGAGNILLGDGSVQQVSTLSFCTNWQPLAGQTTNWPAGHVPSSPSIRVLFP
jgi:competence protein ComGC